MVSNGFDPFEKYAHKHWIISPGCENKTYLKPPTRYEIETNKQLNKLLPLSHGLPESQATYPQATSARIFSRKIAPKKSKRFFQRATNGGPTWLPPVTDMTDSAYIVVTAGAEFCPISGMFHKMFYRIHREASFFFFNCLSEKKTVAKKRGEWMNG